MWDHFAEDIENSVKKGNKGLDIGYMQLQENAYNLLAATESQNAAENDDIVKIPVEYFSPVQNSTFKRHVFRNI